MTDHIYESADNSVVNPLLFGTDAPQAEEELANHFTLMVGLGFYFPGRPRLCFDSLTLENR